MARQDPRHRGANLPSVQTVNVLMQVQPRWPGNVVCISDLQLSKKLPFGELSMANAPLGARRSAPKTLSKCRWSLAASATSHRSKQLWEDQSGGQLLAVGQNLLKPTVLLQISMQPEQKETPEVTFVRFSFLQYIPWRDFGAEFYSYSLKGENYSSRHSGVDVIDWFQIK